MSYLLSLLVAISVSPLGAESDGGVDFSIPSVPEGPRAMKLPEHLEDDPEAQELLEVVRELRVKRYEAYGDTLQQGGIPPRGAQGIPLPKEDLNRVLAIGRKELKKDEIDFSRVNLVLACLSYRPRDREIVRFLKEVMQVPYSIVETPIGSDAPPRQLSTIHRILLMLAQHHTREARALLYECATILIDPEGCKYFRTKEGELMPPLRLELIARNAIIAYIEYAPERQVLPFVRRVSVAYERAGVEFPRFDSLMYLAVELTKGNDLRRQPPPVP